MTAVTKILICQCQNSNLAIPITAIKLGNETADYVLNFSLTALANIMMQKPIAPVKNNFPKYYYKLAGSDEIVKDDYFFQ